jgi:hypothetical protein
MMLSAKDQVVNSCPKSHGRARCAWEGHWWRFGNYLGSNVHCQ